MIILDVPSCIIDADNHYHCVLPEVLVSHWPDMTYVKCRINTDKTKTCWYVFPLKTPTWGPRR